MTKRETWGLIFILIVFSAAALRPSVRGNDGVGHYVYLSSILCDGDLDFNNQYITYDALRQYDYRFADLPVSAVTGRYSNRYGIGASIFWAPFVAAIHGGLKLVHPASANGVSRPYEWAVGMGTAFWGCLGLFLLYRRLRRDWPPLSCGAVLAALVLASPLGFYLYAHGSMSHGVSFFAATALLLSLEQCWHRPRALHFAGCGFWVALLVMTRSQEATWVLVAGGTLLLITLREYRFWRKTRHAVQAEAAFPRQLLLGWLAFSVVSGLTFLPQLVVWQVLYGNWFSGPTPYLDGSAGILSFWPTHFFSVLFSERGGVLAWHPVIALGLLGLILLVLPRPADRPLAVLGLVGFLAQVWLVGCWSIWWAGASFGNRFFITSLPFVAVGMAPWLGRPVGWRRLIPLGVLGLLILWNMGLLYQYATEMVPRETAIPWSQVIRQNLIDVPREIWHKAF